MFFFVILFCSRLSVGQNELSFRLFSVDDGLSESTIGVMTQDSYGFMWFGATTQGLNKFDGYQFTVYQFDPTDTTSISDNFITAIFQDSQGLLWIGTGNGGLNLFDRSNDSFQRISSRQKEDTIISESVNCLIEDADGRLWAGGSSGLMIVDKEKKRLVPYASWPIIKKEIGNVAINRMLIDPQHRLWIGTLDHGIVQLNPDTGDYKLYQHNELDQRSLASNRINGLCRDTHGRIWIATYGGGLGMIYNDDIFTFEIKDHISNVVDNNLVSLFLDDAGDLLIGAEQSGLIKLLLADFNPSFPVFVKYRHAAYQPTSISSDNVNAIYQDRQSNLWISTYKSGLNFYSPFANKFLHYKNIPFNQHSLSNNIVNVIFEDSKERMWIGTDGGGLDLFDRNANSFTHYNHSPDDATSLVHNHVLAVCEDDGLLWVGTWGGLDMFNPETGVFTHYAHQFQNDTPSFNNIVSMVIDNRKKIWLCTYYGLELFDLNTRRFEIISMPGRNEQRLTSNQVLCAFEDAGGNVWVGTRKGLNFISREDLSRQRYHFKHYLHQKWDRNDPRAKEVNTIFQDRDGRLFFGTMSGLYLYHADQDSFSLFTEKDGLPSNGICKILQDEKGLLWISTLSGLARFDLRTKTFVNFDKTDGLQSNEFNFAGCVAKNGELYLGGINGFNVFQPDEIKKNLQPPPVVLTDFWVYNRSVPFGPYLKKPALERNMPEIVIPANVRAFAFEFAALDYTNPSKCAYAYKLEGVDEQWVVTDASRRMAAYRNIPGGRYHFRVKASNSDGVWNEQGLTIAVDVTPPFWQSRWALFIYIAAALTIFFILRQIIMAKLRYEANLALDETKIKLFTHISHEFRTPLTLILGTLETLTRLKTNVDQKIYEKYNRIVIRNSRRLLRLVDQILDIDKFEKGGLKLSSVNIDVVAFARDVLELFDYYVEKNRIKVEFYAAPDEIYMDSDKEKLDKILHNLLSNAFKHTPMHGRISLSIRQFNSFADYEADPAMKKKLAQKKWRHSPFVEICVTNSGEPISDEQIVHLFEQYYQGSQSTFISAPGSGLGLALTKELVDMQDGLLAVQSNEKEGTIFCCLLKSADPTRREEASRTRGKTQDHPQSALEADYSECSPNAVDEKAPLVLIVEDDPDLRSFMCEQLSEYRILEAADGKEGLERTRDAVPDLIVSDVMMPGMNGFEFCRAVKTDQMTDHIPVILLTAMTSEKSQLTGLHLGADDYLTKPFSIDILTARIKNLLAVRTVLQQHFRQHIYLMPDDVPVQKSQADFLERLKNLTDKNMSNTNFSVEDLAFQAGYSRAQLYRKLSALIGQTPHEFILNMRLQRAVQLLKAGSFSVADIARQTGFANSNYFSTCFKKKFNVSPTRFSSPKS